MSDDMYVSGDIVSFCNAVVCRQAKLRRCTIVLETSAVPRCVSRALPGPRLFPRPFGEIIHV